MTKTCVSCRYSDTTFLFYGGYRCEHPSLPVSIGMVTGVKKAHGCWDVRAVAEHCGPEGRWWEPKLSLWTKLKTRWVVK